MKVYVCSLLSDTTLTVVLVLKGLKSTSFGLLQWNKSCKSIVILEYKT